MEYVQTALKLSGAFLGAAAVFMVVLLLMALRHAGRSGLGGFNGKIRANSSRKEKR